MYGVYRVCTAGDGRVLEGDKQRVENGHEDKHAEEEEKPGRARARRQDGGCARDGERKKKKKTAMVCLCRVRNRISDDGGSVALRLIYGTDAN